MFLIKVALQYALFSLLLGVLWMVMTNQFNIPGFLIGFGLGYALLIAVRGKQGVQVQVRKVPSQLLWTVLYMVVLSRDILISGLDVAGRIARRRPLKAGIIKVAVGDTRDTVAALTAHGITITPGQLVVEFSQDEYVYVHCLDTEQSKATIDADQEKRLKFYREMVGDDRA